jgi:GT2 family glycosyltransferase
MNTSAKPAVSVIIPSWDGYRDGCVPRLIESVERQTLQDYELIVVKGVSPQGRAINQGVAQAKADILIILDDDSELADDTVFETLLEALDADDRIGMAGASIVVHPEATPFQRRAADQFPRFQTPVVAELTDSDLACHGCCAFPRAVFEAIGGEREDIVRGLDPDLRVRLREAGYRVVLAPHCRIYHPMPDGWRALTQIFFRNGYGSAYAQKYQPESVYETHEELHDTRFEPRTTLAYRVMRYPTRLAKAILSGQLLRFWAYTVYAAGYCYGMATARPLPSTPPARDHADG